MKDIYTFKSWNPWHGCRKYSEGCANCYMFVLDRAHKVQGLSTEIFRTKNFSKPMERDRKGNFKVPPGYWVRVNMTSDTFLEEADPWREEMWRIIRYRSDVKFYILTKRALRMADHLPADWGEGYENVQLNVTCENQRAFDERWPILRDIPARHKGMNLSPLIGPIDIDPALSSGQIEHIDLGGEAYGGLRPCRFEWVKQISDACARHRVNFAFDSTGEVFIKDGRSYRIPDQKTQLHQAFRSGLSHYYGPVRFNLYDPEYGTLLTEEELYHPRYNLHRCAECSMAFGCAGCGNCGRCKDVELVDLNEIWTPE